MPHSAAFSKFTFLFTQACLRGAFSGENCTICNNCLADLEKKKKRRKEKEKKKTGLHFRVFSGPMRVVSNSLFRKNEGFRPVTEKDRAYGLFQRRVFAPLLKPVSKYCVVAFNLPGCAVRALNQVWFLRENALKQPSRRPAHSACREVKRLVSMVVALHKFRYPTRLFLPAQFSFFMSFLLSFFTAG